MPLFRRKFLAEPSQNKPSFKGRAAAFGKASCRVIFLILCAAATAVLVKCSYPRVSHYALGWVALAPFIMGVVRVKKLWGAFIYSWFTAVLLYGGIFWWVFRTCYEGGGMSAAQSYGAWLGLSALIGLQFAFWGTSCFFLKK